MIPAFRSAIGALGSGSLLIAALVLSRDDLLRRSFVAATEPTAAQIDSDEPAHFAGRLIEDAEPPRADAAKSGGPVPPPVSVQAPQRPPVVFQNASMRSKPGHGDSPVSIAGPSRPVVVLKPEQRPVARRETTSPAPSGVRSAGFVTRLYHPTATSAADLERLIRPLLTPGTWTATANTSADDDDRPGTRPDVLLVRDRPDVVSQIDAIYSDLEATPKRIVIDALIADVAIPDSLPPGWELGPSHFGVIDAEPRTVVNSLRTLGRVSVISTNQLQVIDRQWAQLEWTERACSSAIGAQSVGAQSGAGPAETAACPMTKFRIRPSVLSNGLVRLEVHPTTSRLKQAASVRSPLARPPIQPQIQPPLQTVAFTTDLVLRAGATAVIAGSLDEPAADAEAAASSAAGHSPRSDAPKIHPRPSVRHQTVLLLMPRVSRAN